MNSIMTPEPSIVCKGQRVSTSPSMPRRSTFVGNSIVLFRAV